MALNSQKLVKIPEKNLEEAKRIINNLKLHLKELEKQAEDIHLAEIKKKIKELSKEKQL